MISVGVSLQHITVYSRGVNFETARSRHDSRHPAYNNRMFTLLIYINNNWWKHITVYYRGVNFAGTTGCLGASCYDINWMCGAKTDKWGV